MLFTSGVERGIARVGINIEIVVVAETPFTVVLQDPE